MAARLVGLPYQLPTCRTRVSSCRLSPSATITFDSKLRGQACHCGLIRSERAYLYNIMIIARSGLSQPCVRLIMRTNNGGMVYVVREETKFADLSQTLRHSGRHLRLQVVQSQSGSPRNGRNHSWWLLRKGQGERKQAGKPVTPRFHRPDDCVAQSRLAGRTPARGQVTGHPASPAQHWLHISGAHGTAAAFSLFYARSHADLAACRRAEPQAACLPSPVCSKNSLASSGHTPGVLGLVT